MSRNTICLSMIVRNEAGVIRRCLRSVKPYLDSWVVADTGSTDGTQQIVREELAGIPGRVVNHKWVDFAFNRNLALEEARRFGCDYLLTLDADEELVVPDGGKLAGLTADAYSANYSFSDPTQDCSWRRHLLIKSDRPWQYRRVIHERLELEGASVGMLSDVKVVSHHDGFRNRDQEAKYLADAKAIKRALKSDPNDTRYWFYLGMCLAGAQRIDAAIDAYRKRVSLGEGDTPEEVFYSLYQIAALREFRCDHWRDVVAAYLVAYNERPGRAEPLWRAAQLHADHAEFAIAELYARKAAATPYPHDSLMVHRTVYAWRAAHDLAEYLAEQGKLDEAKAILLRLIDLPHLPESEKPIVRENIRLIEEAA